MGALIFEKTEKGRREIIQRQYGLPARHRLLLLLVDGKQSDEKLLGKTDQLGIKRETFADLLAQDFIHVVISSGQHRESAPDLVPSIAETIIKTDDGASKKAEDYLPVFTPISDEPLLKKGQTQVEAIYSFYTGTIKAMIGLRGFALQLKVERAATLDDMRDLRRPYLDAILRSKGTQVERGLRHELDALLYMNDLSPHMTTTIASSQKQA